MQSVKTTLEEECDEQSLKVLPKVVDNVRKKVNNSSITLYYCFLPYVNSYQLYFVKNSLTDFGFITDYS